MAMVQDILVMGVFVEQAQARRAIEDLRRAGFADERLGFLSRVAVDTTVSAADIGRPAATGAISGGVLGGLLGAAASLFVPGFGPAIAGGILAATLGGAALGATAGSALGILTSVGLSKEDAKFYQRALEDGKTVVTVKATYDQATIIAILQRNGAINASVKFSEFNAPPSLHRPNDESLPRDL